MINPFIDTALYTTVTLHPSELNNSIYTNIKQKLIKTHEGHCYKDYGYMSKIYEVLERDNGYYSIRRSCFICPI